MAELTRYSVRLVARRWLSAGFYEIRLERPDGFDFQAGQSLCLDVDGRERHYTPVTSPSAPQIELCIRRVGEGGVSAALAGLPVGTPLSLTGPHGYFVFRPSDRPAVFVATGAGVAPFVAMVRSGVRGVTLLHGVRSPADLVYADLLRERADSYVPCLPEASGPGTVANAFFGRVTDYLEGRLTPGVYDVYLCGRGEMIRDAIHILDQRCPGSHVYSEAFF